MRTIRNIWLLYLATGITAIIFGIILIFLSHFSSF